MKYQQTTSKITKRTSICSIGHDEMYDFTKKGQSNIYKSKFKPQSKEFVWVEDSCSDTPKKSLKKIIRKWSKKTDRTEKVAKSEMAKEAIEQQTDIQNDLSDLDFNEIFQSQWQNLQGKQRLFESDCLHSRTPTFSTNFATIFDNFLDEVEEIQFGEEQMLIENVSQSDLSNSVPLSYIPVVAITNSQDMEDEEDF